MKLLNIDVTPEGTEVTDSVDLQGKFHVFKCRLYRGA